MSELPADVIGPNLELLEQWKRAAERRYNGLRHARHELLDAKNHAERDFGDGYAMVAPHFNILAEEPVRDFAFAWACPPAILQIAEQRRRDSNDFLGRRLTEVRDRAPANLCGTRSWPGIS